MPVTAPPNRPQPQPATAPAQAQPQPQPASAQAQARHPLQLALILVAAFMVVLDFSIVNVALPSSIQRELHMPPDAVQGQAHLTSPHRPVPCRGGHP